MNGPNDRPAIPMRGGASSPHSPTAQPSAPRVSTAASVVQPATPNAPLVVTGSGLLHRGAYNRLAALTRSPQFRSQPVVALVVLAVVAAVIGLATFADGNPSTPEVGETESTAASASASSVSVVTTPGEAAVPAATLPTGATDFERLAVTSVVSIDIYSNSELCSGGTGTVVLDGNFVLTNLHVVEDDAESDCYADDIVVRYLQRADAKPVEGFSAIVVETNPLADLAVLRLTPIGGSTKVLTPVIVQTTAAITEELMIIGFPAIGGDSVTYSRGIVSGFSQERGIRWIKTDAQISGGNSGGPAFNSRGELVGVPTRASASSGGAIVDCRLVEDTNNDGQIDDEDACVPIGGSFSLLSPASEVVKLLQRVQQ